MTKWQIAFIVVLTLCCSLSMAAQQPTQSADQTESTSCGRYKMRVIKPDEKLDTKAVIQPPTTGVEYKGIVINPCTETDNKAVKSPPRFNDKPKLQPLLKLNPEPEKKLLSPAEMLKKLNQPAAPKPKS
jgi:hypothetical protein